MGGTRTSRVPLLVRGALCLRVGVLGLAVAAMSPPGAQAADVWASLLSQAEELGLPTRFLQSIAPGFLTIEFEDLRAYGAEYHPDVHRMILNRTLSLNAAGGVLRPLRKLSHRDLSTLYHELFHAYFDFVRTNPQPRDHDPGAAHLLALAQAQRRCRYEQVLITPVVQQKSITERRYLTQQESWEALNETWAVFVGWAIWTELEFGPGRERLRTPKALSRWKARLKEADREGSLVGYYAPESMEEQRVTAKRYLAPQEKISPQEVAGLLEVILEFSPEQAHHLSAGLEPRASALPGSPDCPS